MSELAKALAEFGAAMPQPEPEFFLYNGQPRQKYQGDGTGLSHFDHPLLKFAARVEVGEPGECWLWKGAVAKSGYGTVGHALAHRTAWELSNGPIPDGLTVDHICWNTLCCNPAHLQLLTTSANSSRQRPERKIVCKHGHSLADPSNIYRSSTQPHRRYCRACLARRGREYYARKRDAA